MIYLNDPWERKEFHEITFRRITPDNFTVKLKKTNDSPVWFMSLIDYDENCGAYGRFSSQAEAMTHYDAFLAMARIAYRQKHAKMGRTPLITLDPTTSELVMHISGHDDE